VNQYNRDRRKYSLFRGSNKYISRARDSLEVCRSQLSFVVLLFQIYLFLTLLFQSIDGGLDLLLSLVSLDPQNRASALDVLNSSLMTPLRENDSNMFSSEEDEVFCYNAFSTQT